MNVDILTHCINILPIALFYLVFSSFLYLFFKKINGREKHKKKNKKKKKNIFTFSFLYMELRRPQEVNKVIKVQTRDTIKLSQSLPMPQALDQVYINTNPP